jgi:urea transport system permease protein
MANDSIIEIPGIVRRHDRRRLLLMEVGIVALVALVLIFIMPAILSTVRLNQLGRFLALAIAALGIDLIWGYTGLLSLGHGIFFALGGYALAMHLQLAPIESGKLPEFMNLYGVDQLPWFWKPFDSFGLAAIAVMLIPAVVGGLFGYLVFRNRIRGVYFSILTQAATIVFFNFFNGQQKLFNGTNGLTNYQTLLGADVNAQPTKFAFYAFTILFLIAAYALCRWLTKGRFGNLLIAIRDDESRVRFTGYNPTSFKVLVFAISAALAGLGGAMYTLQTGIISPKAMDIAFSIEMVIWVAVGGRGTLIGAILGTILVNFAKSLLSEKFPEIWLFFQGGLFLLVVLVLPNGIVGGLHSLGINSLLPWKRPKRIMTYPTLEEDPDVQHEREEIGH